MTTPRNAWNALRTYGAKCASINPLTLAQGLTVLLVVAMIVSTAAVVIAEILLLLCMLSFGLLRRKLFEALRQPMVLMALAIYGMVTIGLFYGVAPFSERVDLWASWRKMLLVPMVAAVFADPLWKKRLLAMFIAVVALCAVVSFADFFLDLGIKNNAGILLHNHATQGMLFSVALFACLVLLRAPIPRFSLNKWILMTSAVLTAANIILVTPGRSGYLALIVLVIVFVLWGIPRKAKIIVMVLAPVLITASLMLSPVAQERVLQGIAEVQSYQYDTRETSMGLRMALWTNTITLLRQWERPIFGYGTAGFTTAYRELVEEKAKASEGERWQDRPVHDPHNQYLSIMVEYGLVGLLMFLIFIGAFFMQPAGSPYYILGVGVLLAWCATSLFSAHFTTAIEGRFLLVWCAAMLSAGMAAETGEMEPGEGP